ncbi:MAG: type II toxin-antitoxin system RelE/ParE family toxin [Burkholderiaceae bacterium]|nr:MAG: type II toxin-antitoxin system RelE/ParE family toxin [Burkholderiaceae bacterium]
MARFTLLHYCTPDGADPYQQWLSGLRDRQARARVLVRTNRLAEAGQFGDCKPVGDGVWELRIDYGPGYRVYYARAGAAVVLLLIGGDKSSQQADIATAQRHWKDWKQRSAHHDREDRPPAR